MLVKYVFITEYSSKTPVPQMGYAQQVDGRALVDRVCTETC